MRIAISPRHLQCERAGCRIFSLLGRARACGWRPSGLSQTQASSVCSGAAGLRSVGPAAGRFRSWQANRSGKDLPEPSGAAPSKWPGVVPPGSQVEQ